VLLDELAQSVGMFVHEAAGFELRARLCYSIVQSG
jgi:hypothetical protein